MYITLQYINTLSSVMCSSFMILSDNVAVTIFYYLFNYFKIYVGYAIKVF